LGMGPDYDEDVTKCRYLRALLHRTLRRRRPDMRPSRC
jgi:hypothetical protein